MYIIDINIFLFIIKYGIDIHKNYCICIDRKIDDKLIVIIVVITKITFIFSIKVDI
jgi:hypothetical protein